MTDDSQTPQPSPPPEPPPPPPPTLPEPDYGLMDTLTEGVDPHRPVHIEEKR